MLVNVEDRRRIKKVYFKYPALFKSDAEHQVKVMYNELLTTEDQLDQARQEVRELEKKLVNRRKEFTALQSMFTIEFEQKEIEQVDRVSSTLGIVNPSDASNRSYTG